ncbi:MAG: hypoxanthine phosphoribosyltransferase [bacterium]|nr:hypoxanthine phosphoribosyltransferase [bacterium]
MSSYTLVPLITSEQLKTRLEGIVDEIRQAMPVNDLVIIALLKGSFVFLADLIRLLYRHGIEMEIEFMTLRSYGDAAESSGTVTVTADIETNVTGRPVLIVDDILDTGRTLKKAKELVLARGPACVKLCTLLDKPSRRVEPIEADIKGFTIPDYFVVGYGLDYARRHRELPFIARVQMNR